MHDRTAILPPPPPRLVALWGWLNVLWFRTLRPFAGRVRSAVRVAWHGADPIEPTSGPRPRTSIAPIPRERRSATARDCALLAHVTRSTERPRGAALRDDLPTAVEVRRAC